MLFFFFFELIPALVERAKAKKIAASITAERLLPSDVDSSDAEAPTEEMSCGKKVGTGMAKVVFTLSAAVDLFTVFNGIARPFIALLAAETAFWWTIAFAIASACEFIVRSGIYLCTSGTSPWKYASNPSLVALKSIVSAVQIAALIDPSSLLGLSISLGLGALLAIRQLRYRADYSQIRYEVMLIPPEKRQATCVPAKVANVLSRSVEIFTAGVTLAYAAAGIIRFYTQAFSIGALTNRIATFISLPIVLLLGVISAVGVFTGARSKPLSRRHKCGKILSVVDGLLHHIPLQFLLTVAAMFDLYVLSQTQSGQAVVSIPEWMLIFSFSLASVRALFLSAPAVALRSLENYKVASDQRVLQSSIDGGQTTIVGMGQAPSGPCSAFWLGLRTVGSGELSANMDSYVPPTPKKAEIERSGNTGDEAILNTSSTFSL